MSILIVPLIVAMVQAQPAQPQPASIQGIVLKGGSETPLTKATVELQPLQSSGSQPYATTTADDGKFLFPNVQPGQYRVIATRDGYARMEHGQRRQNGRGLPLAISAGQRIANLQFALTPASAVFGRVYDQAGKPMVNATVRAMKRSYQGGRRVLTVEQSARTNDLGEYRLFWLSPGLYYVNALPNGVQAAPGMAGSVAADPSNADTGRMMLAFGSTGLAYRGNPSVTGTYQPIYFPGTPDEESAEPINVRAGMERGGVDLAVFPVSTRQVRGVVMNKVTGRPTRYAELQILRNPVNNTRPSFVSVDPDAGSFRISNIIPGSYTLVASGNRMVGRAVIEVGDRDVEDVAVVVAPGFNIAGRVMIEGGNSDIEHLRVSIVPDPSIQGLEQNSSMLSSDGSFILQDVPSGTYIVHVEGISENAYVKAMHMRDDDVFKGGLRITSEQQTRPPLEILIGTNPGAVEGRVTNERRETIADATVVLVPTNLRFRTELYKTALTDVSGQFRFEAIPPGDYKIFAWEDVEDRAWQDPNFLSSYENQGTAIRIAEGTLESVTVRSNP